MKVSESGHVFGGWIKDKNNPHAVLHRPKALHLPDVINMIASCPKVRDQGQVGSCTGHGIGGIMSGTLIQLNAFTEWESVNWIYNGARFLEGTLNQDAGAMPDDCFTWLTNNGSLLEHFFPYAGVLNTDDPNNFKGNAEFFTGFQAVRVDNGIDGIKSALADGHLVAIGTPWPYSWEVQSGILPEIDGSASIAGGHETFLYGYDVMKGIFFGQNSWGTGWGIQGRYTMPMSAFQVFKDSFDGYDSHYMTFTAMPVPPTPPTPSCKCCKTMSEVLKCWRSKWGSSKT